MKHNEFVLVGHSKMASGLELGMSVFRYDSAAGTMSHIGDYDRELRVGAQTYAPGCNRIYVTDEFWSLPGQTGGGGRVAALALDEKSGQLTQTSLVRTFATNPSYLAVDRTGRYLLVTHHCTEHFVTRMVKAETGYKTKVLYDLCTLLLYRLEENGDIGPIVDVFEVHGREKDGRHQFPHLHCVVPDSERKFFVVCDKGLDKIYSFRIDYKTEKIIKCWETDGKPGSEPRYCNFHPFRSIFFSNCESNTDVNTYELDTQTGAFRLIGSCDCVGRAISGAAAPSDIVVHPSGKFVYVSLRQQNLISALEVQENTLTCRQIIPCGGENPRGLCITPDGRFLLCANMQSAAISHFFIDRGGRLTLTGKTETGGFPGNIQIISVSEIG